MAGRVRDRYKYAPLGDSNKPLPRSPGLRLVSRKQLSLIAMLLILGTIAGFAIVGALGRHGSKSCDTLQHGYQCHNEVSHFWGQYSPYFSVPSEISPEVPPQCKITFAQVLSRHGARDPTASKTALYNATISKIHANATSYAPSVAFLKDYEYTLGADQLTTFGQQEMFNSGFKFYDRYLALASTHTPFMRSSGEARVVESADFFAQGFHHAKTTSKHRRNKKDASYPYPILTIPETDGTNNTLNHGLCTTFEEDPPYATIADAAQETWAGIFLPPIQSRLNALLPGANLSQTETLYLMDLCPFNTVASPIGHLSAFCPLFTETEWHEYDYYETLDKYYGYSNGNPLGPTQGVGWASELLARLTATPVPTDVDSSVNHTLDANPVFFPLHAVLYADFSHDNDMTSIFAALGLYNDTSVTAGGLSNTTVTEAGDAGGYSAAWTVPFASRAYFEKMVCRGSEEEMVRVVVNDRVVPLSWCGGDEEGRCGLGAFVQGLEFVREGGKWGECFA